MRNLKICSYELNELSTIDYAVLVQDQIILLQNFFYYYSFAAGNYSKEEDADQEAAEFGRGIKKINKQPRDNTGKNRYALQFFQETKEELLKRKEDARKALEPCTIEQQEVSDDFFPTGLDMPKRPAWDFSMSKEELDAREQRYFTVRDTFQNIINPSLMYGFFAVLLEEY